MNGQTEEPILLSIICEDKGLTEEEGVKIAKEMGIELYSRGRGEELRYWVVRSNFIEGWLKDFRTYAQPIDFQRRKGYTPPTVSTTVESSGTEVESKWKKKYDNLVKKKKEAKKADQKSMMPYNDLSDGEKEIYDGWKSGKFTLDMGDREIIRGLRGDKDWKVGRNIISQWRKFNIFEQIKK